MPTIEKHIQKSIERTGKEYKEIHEWIDDPEKKDVTSGGEPIKGIAPIEWVD